MPMRLALGAPWLLALALSAGSAHADLAPPPPSTPVAAKQSEGGKHVLPHAARPIFVGLLAAMFLLVAGAAGANDKPRAKR